MWMKLNLNSKRILALIFAVACLAVTPAKAAARSQLSYWLSDTALAEIKTLASGHPRVTHRSLQISHQGKTALEEAIAITLQKSLRRVEQLQLIVPSASVVRSPDPAASVDELVCNSRPVWDNELQVTVRELDHGQAEVQLHLVDMAEPDVAFQSWRWQGSLSAAEHEFHTRAAQRVANAGTMNAPWAEAELEQAAAQLSEQLACSLRPDIVRRVTLQWPGQQTIPAPLDLAVSEARRRLDYYREISATQQDPDYQVKVEWHAVSDGIWQLSVAATPQSDRVASAQVATYIEARLPLTTADTGQHRTSPTAVPLVEPGPGKPASEYLQVEMLDVSQSDSGWASAGLRVRLRLANRANRPLEYGLSLSGGHYLQCIPEPRYYRHDRYGYAQGRLAPGQSVVRVMEIEGARHSPNPLLGTPKCAGFKGLEGLEDFDNQGHKVTQFIRWTL